jgi:hypothetical protein
MRCHVYSEIRVILTSNWRKAISRIGVANEGLNWSEYGVSAIALIIHKAPNTAGP